jgi:O-antigen/teichoic acid export membrane protein
VIAPLIVFLIWFNDELLTLIFGLSYLGASDVLIYLGLGAFLFAMIVVFGFQLLALKRQWLPLVLGLGVGAASGLMTGFWFLNEGGGLLGVAAAAVTAKGLSALMVMIAAARTWKFPSRSLAKALLRPLLPILGTVALLRSTMWLSNRPTNPVPNLLIMLVGYTLFFTALNFTEARWALARIYERLAKRSST